jgi:tetratricopeptide (TPR) repeat protein
MFNTYPAQQWGSPVFDALLIFGLIGGYFWWVMFKESRSPKTPPSEVGQIVGVFSRLKGLTNRDVGVRYVRSPEYAFDMGLRYEGVGENFTAMAYFKEAVEMRPQWAEARYHLGKAYIQLKERDKAQEQLNALTEMGAPWAERLSEHF